MLSMLQSRMKLSLLHVLVDLRGDEYPVRIPALLMTHMLVKEEAVHAPGEGLAAPVEEVIRWGLRELSAVLVLEVLNVSSMLGLSVVDPGCADSDC